MQTGEFKATTYSKHKLPVADNLLEQNFASNRFGEVWVADITYISTEEEWLYLAGIIRIVAVNTAPTITRGYPSNLEYRHP